MCKLRFCSMLNSPSTIDPWYCLSTYGKLDLSKIYQVQPVWTTSSLETFGWRAETESSPSSDHPRVREETIYTASDSLQY